MARRKTEVFSMSFLDCITCAFGSVVLVYVLINAQGGLRKSDRVAGASAPRSRKLEEQVLEGYQHLVQLRNSMIMTEDEKVQHRRAGHARPGRDRAPEGGARRLPTRRRCRAARRSSGSRPISSRSKKARAAWKARATDPSATGTRVRGFVGTGDRQYLTGLKVGGEHILRAGRRLRQHARRNSRQRPAHAQHVRDAQADVGEVAAHAFDRRLARGAAAAGSAVPDVRIQHQGLGAAAEAPTASG